MNFKMKGVLHKVFDTEHKTDSFRTRLFVLECMNEERTDYIKFQLRQNRCDLIESYKVGQPLEVSFSIIGKVWNERYFTTLDVSELTNTIK